MAEQVALPPAHVSNGVGEFGELQEAIDRLAVAVPLSLALICMLLFLNFGSMTDTILAARRDSDGHGWRDICCPDEFHSAYQRRSALSHCSASRQ